PARRSRTIRPLARHDAPRHRRALEEHGRGAALPRIRIRGLPDPAYEMARMTNRTPLLLAGSAVLLALLVLSGLEPFDRLTWVAEVAPVVIAWPILAATHRRFP